MIITNKDGSYLDIEFQQRTLIVNDKGDDIENNIMTLDRSLYLVSVITYIRLHEGYIDAIIPQELFDELCILKSSDGSLNSVLDFFIYLVKNPNVNNSDIDNEAKILFTHIKKFFQRIVHTNIFNAKTYNYQHIDMLFPMDDDDNYIPSKNFYLTIFLNRIIYLLDMLRSKKMNITEIDNIFKEISFMPLTETSKNKIFCLKELYDNDIEIPESIFDNVIIDIDYNGRIEKSGKLDYIVDSN